MTKKDYIRAAALLNHDALDAFRRADAKLDAQVENTARFLVSFFAGDNPKFDTDKFLKAVYKGVPDA